MHCAACTRTRNPTRICPCATCIWLLHPAPTSPKMVLILCNLHWWCYSYQLTQKLYILVVVITCNLHSWCFHMPTCPFTGVHKHTWAHIATCNCYKLRKLYSLFKVNNLYWCIFPIMSTFCIIDVIVNSVNSFCSTSIII